MNQSSKEIEKIDANELERLLGFAVELARSAEGINAQKKPGLRSSP